MAATVVPPDGSNDLINSLQTSHICSTHRELGLPAFCDTWYTDLTCVCFFFVAAVQWLHYTPQWCGYPPGDPYRRDLKTAVTSEQCKQACICLPGCAAIEYWPVVKTCNECLDHSKRIPFTDTSDSLYPPHVYIKQKCWSSLSPTTG